MATFGFSMGRTSYLFYFVSGGHATSSGTCVVTVEVDAQGTIMQWHWTNCLGVPVPPVPTPHL
jgi:hypothetical protein